MSLSPNIRRYLPFLLIAFFLLIILPTVFKHRATTTSTITPATQSAETIKAVGLVDHAEQAYQAATGRYTRHVADVLFSNAALADDLANGFVIQLDVSTNGKSYYELVQSPVQTMLRARHDGKISANTCVIVKSGTGVACPTTAPKSAAKTTSK